MNKNTEIGATYEAAGVNLEGSRDIKDTIKALATQTYGDGVVGGVGGFGAMYKIAGYANPILVTSTDPVGTKLMVAGMVGSYENIGADLVNACVNDLIVIGADPLFFLDYIATSKMNSEVVEILVKGIAEACLSVDCALIGGETSEMPGMFAGDNFDVSGFIVGAVEAPGTAEQERSSTAQRAARRARAMDGPSNRTHDFPSERGRRGRGGCSDDRRGGLLELPADDDRNVARADAAGSAH